MGLSAIAPAARNTAAGAHRPIPPPRRCPTPSATAKFRTTPKTLCAAPLTISASTSRASAPPHPRNAAATPLMFPEAPIPGTGTPTSSATARPRPRGATSPRPRQGQPRPTLDIGENPLPADRLRPPPPPASDTLTPPGQGTVTCNGLQPNPCTYTPAPVAVYDSRNGEVTGPDGSSYTLTNSSHLGDDGWKQMLAHRTERKRSANTAHWRRDRTLSWNRCCCTMIRIEASPKAQNLHIRQ